jgi:hypothetical protein
MPDPPEVQELFPDDEEQTPEEELFAVEEALDAQTLDLDADLAVTLEPPPQPIGRAWAYDFDAGQHILSGHGPLTVHGDQTLMVWIEKCIRTQAGAHPIHPPGYGLAKPLNDYLGEHTDANSLVDLEQDISDALTFHPAITRIEDFEVTLGPDRQGEDNAAAQISFSVQRDDGTDLQFDMTTTSGETLSGDLALTPGGANG